MFASVRFHLDLVWFGSDWISFGLLRVCSEVEGIGSQSGWLQSGTGSALSGGSGGAMVAGDW